MSEFTVTQGTTGPLLAVYSSDMVTTAGWVCTEKVISPSGLEVISRPVTATNQDGDQFIAMLSETDINQLDVDTYLWKIRLSNDSVLPAFEAVQTHHVYIEPQITLNVDIVRGVNAFGTYGEIITHLASMPQLAVASGFDRMMLKATLVQAWENIGKMHVDFGNGLSSTLDFDEQTLMELTTLQRRQLNQAVLIEADFLLGGNPVEQRRRMGMMSDSTGESAHFLRPTKPIQLPICREAALALTPYVVFNTRIG